MRLPISLGIFLCFNLASNIQAVSSPPELGVETFLDQVKSKNDDYNAAKTTSEASQIGSTEADFLTAPTLFADGKNITDKKPNTLYTMDSSETTIMQVGVAQQTNIGLAARLYYNLQDQKQNGFALGGPPQDLHFRQASPVLELSLPLMRNFLGAETKGQIEQAKAGNQANHYMQRFKMKSVLVQAEATYWQLVLARETIKVSANAVERHKQLVAWHKSRSQTGLADRSDLLQAEAALQANQLNLKMATDNEVILSRAFNLTRGQDSDAVSEKLAPLSTAKALAMPMPERGKNREDILAAEKSAHASELQASNTAEKYKPTLEVYSSMAYNNDKPSDTSAAVSNSFKGDKPTLAIGVRLNMFLDRDLVGHIQQARNLEKTAANQTLDRKKLELDSQWKSLSQRVVQIKEKAELWQKLENKQKEKVEHERSRRQAGRATTQQILLFELDYQQAQFGRIQALSDLMQTLAQMKAYQGDAQ